tara:strand:+ start:2319 stop:2651 length:333 start_codon:yes stop_codon:yes gene_type:complete
MVVLGALVKEDCSIEAKARVGTIVKVTPLVLSHDGLKQAKADIEHAKKMHFRHGKEYDPTSNFVIRPGCVFSVRWQHDPSAITVHIAYDDCQGQALINLGTNSVRVVSSG